MITLAHPFRVDPSGSVVTVEQGSARHAAETAGHVLACIVGERALAPLWGLVDPSGGRVDPDEVAATLAFCEPGLTLTRCDITTAPDGGVTAGVDVQWTDTDTEESR